MIKGKATWIHVYMLNTSTGEGQSGDASNIGTRIVSDNSSAATTNDVEEVDATNIPGLYRIRITAAENVGEKMTLHASSSTANVQAGLVHWANEHNMAAINDQETVDALPLEQALRLMLAALGGKVSGAGTSTITFRNLEDDTNRIVATVDADGNRSAVTLDLA